MGSNGGRARGKETAVGIFLLIVIIVIAAGVLVKHSTGDISRFGFETNQKQEVELGSLTPEGFEKFSEMEVYVPENLYVKINGAAPLYIESGVVGMKTQRFVSTSDDELWFEMYVFDMGNVRNAFSVYSTQRVTGLKSLNKSGFAYKTGNALFFLHGNYYVKLVGSQEKNDELFKAMEAVAKRFEADMAVKDDTAIEELKLFVKEGMIEGSGKLYLSATFSYGGLDNTFVGLYKVGDEEITAFFSPRSSSSEARKVAKSYRDFLIENGAKERKSANIDAQILELYGYIEIVFTKGRFVGGVHEAEDLAAAEKMASVFIKKLK